MSKITRRAALAVIPSIAIVPAAAAPADSPIMVLFWQWEAIYRQSWDDETSEEEAEECFDQMADLEARLLATPVTDAKDLAAKLIVYTMYGDATLREDRKDGPVLTEAKALVGVEGLS